MLSKIANSLSASLLVLVGVFVFGVAGSALFFRDAKIPSAAPWALCFFALMLVGMVLIKNKKWRLVVCAALLFASGVARYLSSSETDNDLAVYLPFLNAAKTWLVAAVTKMLPEPHAGFLEGLLVGTGAGSPDIKAAFVATGTAHVMALSGWNVTIISKWCDRVLAFFHLGKNKRLTLVTLLIGAFVVATGASSSLVRAAVMGLLVTIATAGGRRSSAGRAVVFAAAAMLIISPRIIVSDLGFLLSVAATLGMIYLAPFFKPFADRLPERFKISETVAGTLGATMATLPITLVVFGQTSLVALPANLLLLPFVAPTMLVGFVGALVSSFVASFTPFCAWATSLFTAYDLSLVKLLARIPGASLSGLYVGSAASILMVVGIIFVVIKNHDQLVEEKN